MLGRVDSSRWAPSRFTPKELDVGTKSKRTCTSSEIRWMAIVMTPWMWVVGSVILMLYGGQPLHHAVPIGAMGALGGLIAWAIYHGISHRNDGLGIFIMALVAQNQPAIRTLRAAVAIQIISIIIISALAVAFSSIIRKPQRDEGKATDCALRDPEFDLPSKTRGTLD